MFFQERASLRRALLPQLLAPNVSGSCSLLQPLPPPASPAPSLSRQPHPAPCCFSRPPTPTYGDSSSPISLSRTNHQRFFLNLRPDALPIPAERPAVPIVFNDPRALLPQLLCPSPPSLHLRPTPPSLPTHDFVVRPSTRPSSPALVPFTPSRHPSPHVRPAPPSFSTHDFVVRLSTRPSSPTFCRSLSPDGHPAALCNPQVVQSPPPNFLVGSPEVFPLAGRRRGI